MTYNIGIVVLTKGLKKNSEWHSDLDARLNLATAVIRYNRYKKQGCEPFLILSGGQIDKRQPTLSSVMQQEARDYGIPKQDIFLEEDSIDTTENAEFSKPIIEKNLGKAGILEVITNHFHSERSKTCFNIYGLNPIMISSESELMWGYANQIGQYLQSQRIRRLYKRNRRFHSALKLLGPKPFRWYLHRIIERKGWREP